MTAASLRGFVDASRSARKAGQIIEILWIHPADVALLSSIDDVVDGCAAAFVVPGSDIKLIQGAAALQLGGHWRGYADVYDWHTGSVRRVFMG